MLKEYENTVINLENILNEKNAIIDEYETKIAQMTHEIEKQDEQLKILIKITNGFNTENKSNVDELTKQATSTIKVLYNTLNNNNDKVIVRSGKMSNIDLFDKEQIIALIKNNDIAIVLEEAMEKYQIPEGSTISRELLNGIGFKFELLKVELFSSLIREMNMVKYFSNSVGESLGEEIPDKLSLESIIASIKAKFEEYEKEIQRLNKENKIMQQECEGSVKKLQDNVKMIKNFVQTKCSSLETNFIKSIDKKNKEIDNLKQTQTIDIEKQIHVYSISKEINILFYGKPTKILNQLFIEENHQSKIQEINKLKDELYTAREEITKLKNEIATLALRPPVIIKEEIIQQQPIFKNLTLTSLEQITLTDNKKIISLIEVEKADTNKSDIQCQSCSAFWEKLNEFKNTIKSTTFKELKQFYLVYQMEVEKVNNKIEEVATKLGSTDANISRDSQEKKISVKDVRETLSTAQKMLTVLGGIIGKYGKNLNYHTSNLKRMFDFISKLLYSQNSNTSMSMLKTTFRNVSFVERKNLFEHIFKMIIDITKIIPTTIIRKTIQLYENKSVLEVLEVFKMQCDIFKTNMNENRFEIESI